MLFVYQRIVEIPNLQMRNLKQQTLYFIVLSVFRAVLCWIEWMIKLENPNITTIGEPQQLLTAVTNKLQDDPDLLKRSISPTGSDKLNDPHSKKIKPDGKNLPKETRVEPVVARDSEKLTDISLKKSKVENSTKMPVNANNLNGVGTFGTKSETGKINIANKDMKMSIVPVDKLENRERNKTPSGSDTLQTRPFKKQKFDFETPLMETKVELKDMSSKKLILNKSKHEDKLPVDVNNLKALGISGSTKEKLNQRNVDNKSKHEDKLPADVNNLKALGTSGSTKEKLNQRNGKVSLKVRDALKGNTIKKTEVELKDKSSKKSIVDNKSKHEDKLPADVNNLKALGTSGSTKEKLNQMNGKVSLKVTDALEGNTVKKTKDDCSQELSDNRTVGNNTNGSSGEDLVASSASSKGLSKSGLDLDSVRNNKKQKKEQSDENKKKLAMNKLLKGSALSNDRDKKIMYQEFVCGPKPNTLRREKMGEMEVEESEIPWDQRLKTALDQGTAVLLHNVDPDFTSADIEDWEKVIVYLTVLSVFQDIVWNAFNDNCEAKIVQRTAVSSPHHGQALILLKTKEVAQRILVRLDKECLILSNERPLVATVCPPISTEKHSSFFGHLVLDKNRVRSQREDKAVSTSHFSQPSTIEYDMAMVWCLLQSRSKKWWDKIHMEQGLELKKLESPRVQK
nr:protein anti-silencing 1 [Tanacetum cinerariifolium]